jgi:hypothetical protein
MREIRSLDSHGGWSFSVSSTGVREEIIHALCNEWNIPTKKGNVRIKLAPLKLLPHSKQFVFRASCGARSVVGSARVDIEAFQNKPGEEYVSSFVRVFIGE